ncbi:hypothetical protein [Prevotella pallens]|uniref:hypothetical protein n=1 Tax=Prevotella pallens TaxID=60133 RepID=UPI001CB63E66|nr:hypothetical protein [Prevotella pallens]MBF1464787.1 hypothetical protein [Prevotella pallens]
MQHPYIKYEQDKTWTVVNDLINDLINNNDIELQTPIEYVVGYICKGLLDSQVINGGWKGRNTPNQELSK